MELAITVLKLIKRLICKFKEDITSADSLRIL